MSVRFPFAWRRVAGLLSVFILLLFLSAPSYGVGAAPLGHLRGQAGNGIGAMPVPPSPPPVGFVPPPQRVHNQLGDVMLSNVPAYSWCYGCSPTAAGMMMGYYDLNGYPNMYAGPSNGGACPLDNEPVWGHAVDPIAGEIGECPFIASHEGIDGRATRGHVDDYWSGYDSNVDPYMVNGWTPHTDDSVADFMGTSQYVHFGNPDGTTMFYYNMGGDPLFDYIPISGRDGCHGMRLYAESRGYRVTENYTQLIFDPATTPSGFTYGQYCAEIDAGHPVMIQVMGHSMVGVGYNKIGSIVYLHTTWGNYTDQMTWGGTFDNMQQWGVTVLHLAPNTPLSGVSLAVTPASPQTIYTPMTLTALPTEGNNVTYTFQVQGSDGNWTTLSQSATPTTIWQPTVPDTYTLQVQAVDISDPNGTVFTDQTTFVVTPPLSIVTLAADPQGPSTIDTAIALSANAVGGAQLVYKFEANGVAIQDYSASAQCTWSPVADGMYTLQAKVKDLNSPQPDLEVASQTLSYKIVQPTSLVTLSADKTSPVLINEPVQLTAEAVGGAHLLYQFKADDAIIRAYDSSNTCQWIPTDPGSYTLVVSVKDQNSETPDQELFSEPLGFEVTDTLSDLSLTATPDSLCAVNAQVTMTADSMGGSRTVYRFTVTNSTSTVAASSYTAASIFQWVPKNKGNYTLHVFAKDLDDPATPPISTSLPYTVTAPLTSVSLSMNPDTPVVVGMPVQLTAHASGGANLAFSFEEGGTTLQDFSSASTCEWVPQNTGMTSLTVSVCDLNGADPNKTLSTVPYTVQVVDPLSGVDLSTDMPSPSPINTPITLQAVAYGGAHPEYKFSVSYDEADGTTTTIDLQDFSSQSTCLWTPKVSNNYTLIVEVRERGETDAEYSTSIPFEVTPPIPFTVALETDPSDTCTVNTRVTLNAYVSDGSNAKYRFRVGYQDAWRRWRWSDIRVYSNVSTITWTPTVARKYTLVVWALKPNSTNYISYDACASTVMMVTSRKKR